MKVDRINFFKDHYKVHLAEDVHIEEAYKYDALKNFQDNWDLSELDLGSMFNKSLSSKLSGRLWSGSRNSPKSVMLAFIEMNKEFVRSTFRDLFDESKDIIMRMQRFSFHCDELLKDVLNINKHMVSHKHSPRMVSVYLALRYPEQYTVYDYKNFVRCLELFDSNNIPMELEIDKYFRLCHSLNTILLKDESLVELHGDRIKSMGIDMIPSLFIVHDFLEFVSFKGKKLI